MLRLSSKGAEAVAAWFSGTPVGHDHDHQHLGWRLVNGGLATLRLGSTPLSPTPVDIVIPVKDDLEGLLLTLHSLFPTAIAPSTDIETPEDAEQRHWRVIVVDDGSQIPITRSLLDRVGVCVDRSDVELSLVSQRRSRGPADARNRGLSLAAATVVAFIDAGVTISGVDLDRLVGETLEPNTVAVAPRVRPDPLDVTRSAGPDASDSRQARLVADYEERFSALDLGSHPGLAGSGRPVPYVPSTCLVVRTRALHAVDGFNRDLRYGEDVDLVWRLTGLGWVRYLPVITVGHPPRSSIAGMASQRFHYGTAAGPLARRHGRAIAAARLSPAMAVIWLGAATRTPLLSLIAAAWSMWRLRDSLSSHPTPIGEASALLANGIVQSGRGLSSAAARVWWPAYPVLAKCWPRAARVLLLLTIAGWLRRVRPESGLAALPDLALGVLDDCAYGLGVWSGAAANGTVTALVPDIHWP